MPLPRCSSRSASTTWPDARLRRHPSSPPLRLLRAPLHLLLPLHPGPPVPAARRVETALDSVGSRERSAFTSLLAAFGDWDAAVGCPRIRAKLLAAEPGGALNATAAPAVPSITGGAGWGGARCGEMRRPHVGVLVKGWTWIPDALDGVYTCRCGVSCVWSKAAAVVDRPDALLFEGATPPQHVLQFVPSLPSDDAK